MKSADRTKSVEKQHCQQCLLAIFPRQFPSEWNKKLQSGTISKIQAVYICFNGQSTHLSFYRRGPKASKSKTERRVEKFRPQNKHFFSAEHWCNYAGETRRKTARGEETKLSFLSFFICERDRENKVLIFSQEIPMREEVEIKMTIHYVDESGRANESIWLEDPNKYDN